MPVWTTSLVETSIPILVGSVLQRECGFGSKKSSKRLRLEATTTTNEQVGKC
jgi:hypothetical protein